jgi:hypothetical protein
MNVRRFCRVTMLVPSYVSGLTNGSPYPPNNDPIDRARAVDVTQVKTADRGVRVERSVRRQLSGLYVMNYAIPTLCNMPQHASRVNNVCNAKPPRLQGRGLGGGHAKVFGKIK